MPLLVAESAILLHCFAQVLCPIIWTITSISLTSTLFYLRHMSHLCSILKPYCKVRKQSRKSANVHTYFLAEHSWSMTILLASNREIWGGMTLKTLACMLPANVYILAKVLTNRSNFNLIIVLLTQQVFLFLGLYPQAQLNKSIHQFKKFIPTIQFGLPRQQLLIKIKYDSLLLRLTRGPKYGITMGPLATITFRSTLEVFLLYVGHFIWVLNMYHKRRVLL